MNAANRQTVGNDESGGRCLRMRWKMSVEQLHGIGVVPVPDSAIFAAAAVVVAEPAADEQVRNSYRAYSGYGT